MLFQFHCLLRGLSLTDEQSKRYSCRGRMNASNKRRLDEKKCGVYSRAAFNYIFACPCGVYSREAFIQGRRLFE